MVVCLNVPDGFLQSDGALTQCYMVIEELKVTYLCTN